MITDKELAEKVALKLGWILNNNKTRWIDDNGFLKSSANKLSENIFSWPTFGLIVEKAESMGWGIQMGNFIWFERLVNNSYYDHTQKDFSIKEHGHIKACCLAFCEIPDHKSIQRKTL